MSGDPPRGPLTPEQVRKIIQEHFPNALQGSHEQLTKIIQLAASLAIAQHRPGLLTDDEIAALIDLDTLCESGDHADLHAAYQAAACMGAALVFAVAIRKVPQFNGPECYVCRLCDSVRASTPESIPHKDECAALRERMKAR